MCEGIGSIEQAIYRAVVSTAMHMREDTSAAEESNQRHDVHIMHTSGANDRGRGGDEKTIQSFGNAPRIARDATLLPAKHVLHWNHDAECQSKPREMHDVKAAVWQGARRRGYGAPTAWKSTGGAGRSRYRRPKHAVVNTAQNARSRGRPGGCVLAEGTGTSPGRCVRDLWNAIERIFLTNSFFQATLTFFLPTSDPCDDGTVQPTSWGRWQRADRLPLGHTFHGHDDQRTPRRERPARRSE